MAAGKVCTGFSHPYVALYASTGGAVTYSSGQKLARGVDVTISPEAADDNVFYADNIAAETIGGTFSGGEVSLTVDGLLVAAEKLIMGLPDPTTLTVGGSSVNIFEYGDAQTIPYVGIAFVVRYMSDGVTSYVPFLLTKARFNTFETTAATQEDAIGWQTQSLTAVLMRDDTAAHNWKKLAEGQSTEADAEAVIKAWFNISAPQNNTRTTK